ncbi:hypothetical protein SCP_1900130 [Sparassis crispa]|uniref:Uncharacterized protein n=1 Tax=Sparassis crispa TaxID=139825 RepID=A0A401H6X1_9APHY|nr:hypothetical protein SCP_1900130 [Sparassis crispa]GBE90164.1 hypothetical protein SCP_1900130 [Sparassis crispa]
MPKASSERVRRAGKRDVTISDLQRLLVTSEMEVADLRERIKEMKERYKRERASLEAESDEEWDVIRRAARGDDNAWPQMRRLESDIPEETPVLHILSSSPASSSG